MPDQRYTLTGDSQVEDGVRNLLAQFTAAVVAELTPAAVVLSGSFARGEGGAYQVDGAIRATSDIDLTVVYRGPTSLLRAILARPGAARLAAKLNRTFPSVRVDLATRPAALLRWPAATLDSYELLRSGRALYGTVRLAPPSQVRIEDIPPGEIAQQLCKRGVGLLISWVRLMTAEGSWDADVARSVQLDVDKAFLACGDAWLFRYGEYDHRLLVRVERFRALPRLPHSPTARLREEYERSAHDRLHPSADLSPLRTAHLERWQRAVEEWLRCDESYASWTRDTRPSASTPQLGRHPVQTVRRAINALRRVSRGLPNEGQQREALPLLLQLTLADRDDAALRGTASALLQTPTKDPADLPALVSRILLAWHPSGAALAAARQATSITQRAGGQAGDNAPESSVERAAVQLASPLV